MNSKKSFILGKGYTHFAVCKKSGLIVTGWDYKGYNHSELMEFKKDYFEMDLLDMDVKLKDVRIVKRSVLIKKVDVTLSCNWFKSQNDVQSNAISMTEIDSLIVNNDLTLSKVIDRVIELNGIVGVGLISLGDDLQRYVHNKIKP